MDRPSGHQKTSTFGGGDCDQTLLTRIIAREVDAFEDLCRSYGPRLRHFLSLLVHRPQMVDEVMDDALVAVWDRAHTFNRDSRLSILIFGIAYRKAMTALRHLENPAGNPTPAERVCLEVPPEDARLVQRALLMRAMSELSPEHRAIVELTYFNEMGYRDIAKIMKCSASTVKTRMFHARRHLKQCVSIELPDHSTTVRATEVRCHQ